MTLCSLSIHSFPYHNACPYKSLIRFEHNRLDVEVIDIFECMFIHDVFDPFTKKGGRVGCHSDYIHQFILITYNFNMELESCVVFYDTTKHKLAFTFPQNTMIHRKFLD